MLTSKIYASDLFVLVSLDKQSVQILTLTLLPFPKSILFTLRLGN